MRTTPRTTRPHSFRRHPQRGGLLVTALLIAALIALGLSSYLKVSRTSLSLAHRTFFANAAINLAEAGLEDALCCFNLMGAGTPLATAWSGWTISGANAMRTLPAFNLDQSGVGVVKVHVTGYNGSVNIATIIAQATITPFDGSAPVVKILRTSLQRAGVFTNGVVGVQGVTLKGKPFFDSFNSNPTNSPTGPWRTYSSAIATSNTSVVVPTGTVSLGNGMIYGNLSVGPAVSPPPASQVSGTIQTNFTGTFRMPAYPTPASVSRSYTLGSTVPASLPVTGHLPAADGRYYYFVSGTTLTNLTITAGKNVSIIGTTTSLSSGLTIGSNATCAIYIDGVINASSQGSLNNSNWAGALLLFSTTTSECSISGNGELRASVYTPFASLKATGGGSSGSVVGSYVAKTITATGQMSFHYDEALRNLNTGGGNLWGIIGWSEFQSASDRASVSSLTGNFLP